jgi:hypothetical protein
VVWNLLQERKIRKVLKRIAGQRVLRLTANNVWVIHHALRHSTEIDDALATCRLRGWIEKLDHAVPAPSDYTEREDEQHLLDLVEPLYRLTGSGWDVVHRRQSLIVFATAISALSASVAMSMLLINLSRL